MRTDQQRIGPLKTSQDDIDGMNYLYPSDELNGDKMAGCGLVRNAPPPKGPLSILTLILLAIPFVVGLGKQSRLPAHCRQTIGDEELHTQIGNC